MTAILLKVAVNTINLDTVSRFNTYCARSIHWFYHAYLIYWFIIVSYIHIKTKFMYFFFFKLYSCTIKHKFSFTYWINILMEIGLSVIVIVSYLHLKIVNPYTVYALDTNVQTFTLLTCIKYIYIGMSVLLLFILIYENNWKVSMTLSIQETCID